MDDMDPTCASVVEFGKTKNDEKWLLLPTARNEVLFPVLSQFIAFLCVGSVECMYCGRKRREFGVKHATCKHQADSGSSRRVVRVVSMVSSSLLWKQHLAEVRFLLSFLQANSRKLFWRQRSQGKKKLKKEDERRKPKLTAMGQRSVSGRQLTLSHGFYHVALLTKNSAAVRLFR
ncbi:hypothetical protein B296_00016516 [Ensete ventricosum]|uniref:Uncharacterized protein n=1 Tax=Ensete ventricosum TaxID=4639 RepID=A0A426Z336_ENSVE|nr:hypothetical protein B296_00016516 [Ensete ventricosum]